MTARYELIDCTCGKKHGVRLAPPSGSGNNGSGGAGKGRHSQTRARDERPSGTGGPPARPAHLPGDQRSTPLPLVATPSSPRSRGQALTGPTTDRHPGAGRRPRLRGSLGETHVTGT